MMERKIRKRDWTGSRSRELTDRERLGAALSKKAALAGIVLLKNENHVLPLRKEEPIVLYGSGALHTVKGGTGSGDVNERYSISIFEGLKDAGCHIVNEAWIEDYGHRFEEKRRNWRDDILEKSRGAKEATAFFGIYTANPFVRPMGGPIEKLEAKTAIYVLSRIAGEGADRRESEGDYYLSREEEEELGTVCSYYEKVILIINTGGVIDLEFLDKYPNIFSLLYISQPGMEGGNAVADILLGKETPSGKLTASWAYHYKDYPNGEEFSYKNGNTEEEYYTEGIYVGYRYFDSYEIPVRYGFGYGLSYTEFSLDSEEIGLLDEGGWNKKVTLSVNLRNIGDFRGREVVQVYVSLPEGILEKEYRRLVGFKKSGYLLPEESQTLSIEFSLETMTSFDEEKSAWVLEKGVYGIWIGNDLSSSSLVGGLEIGEEVSYREVRHICEPQKRIEEFRRTVQIRKEQHQAVVDQIAQRNLSLIRLSREGLVPELVVYKSNADLSSSEGMDFLEKIPFDKIRRLATGDPGKAQGAEIGSAGKTVPGAAAETSSCAEEYGLSSLVLADGPAGLRLQKYYFVKDQKIVSLPFQFNLEGGIFVPDAEEREGEKYYQYCTAIPVGTMLAQSFDEDLMEEIGQMIAGEMEAFHVTLWLAPGMNIQRNPLCGRNFEYYSEDPFLTGKIGAAITKGVQKQKGRGVTIKHFACNNNEDNRMGCDSILSERALREIYLRAFGIVIREAKPMALMTSYNLVNGIHAANHYDLCTNAARNEFGFEGLIMTDWTTTENGPDCTAAGCMRAGNDIIMPGNVNDQKNLEEELAEGSLLEEDVRACVSRLVRCVFSSDSYE